jgi:rare lipoprotein A
VPAIILYVVLLFAAVAAPHLHRFKTTHGIASYYGRLFAGKKMANGQPFDPKKTTCASRTYPLGTRLRVTYPTTGKSVVVTVTDKGPWTHGRVLDLSERAAKKIGMINRGIGFVNIEPLENQ